MIAPMTSEGASRTAAPRRGPGFGSRYAVATDHPLRAALLAPALRHAEEGFPVSQRLSRLMAALAEDASPQSAEARSVFLKVGAPYAPGETLRQLGLAQTLRRIAEDEREGFYGGETAGRIAREMAAAGGLIDKDDLAEQTAVWSEPIKTAYAGCEVYEQALPSQGIILLEALNIVEAFPLRDWGAGSADAIHVMVEAVKMAFADRRRYAADPLVEEVPLERLPSHEHGRAPAPQIAPRGARG